MAHPEDFPKALYASMIAEFVLFTITGAVVYYYAGTQYTTAPDCETFPFLPLPPVLILSGRRRNFDRKVWQGSCWIHITYHYHR
jgi:hypothetical protein